jgi:pimeloyl-ACP methyl ester carboxylesterase
MSDALMRYQCERGRKTSVAAVVPQFGQRSRIQAGTVELAVTVYGDHAQPLILLHGIGSRGISWLPILEPLSARFQLVVPDLRGHGDSDKPSTGYLVSDYVADLDALIAALRLRRPVIVGHSLGALIALAWAARHPDEAAGIVLEDPPLRPDPQAPARLDGWLALAQTPVDEVARRFKQEHPDWSDEACWRRARSITGTAPAVFTEMREVAERGEAFVPFEQLSAVQSPILLVHGEPMAGSATHPRDVERISAIAPRAKAVQIAQGGHSLHRDHTEAFLAAVLPFLDECCASH